MSLSELRFDHVFMGTTEYERSIQFYQDTLGFEVISEWGDSNSGRGAIAKHASGFQVNLAEAHGSGWPDGSQRGAATIHFRVKDVDELYRNIRSRVEVAVELENAHWGVRWFVIRDPSGILLAFFSGEHP